MIIRDCNEGGWNILFWVFIAFLGLLTIGYFYEPGEDAKASAAIDLCWEEYERKSLTPEQKRFIAGSCEMMEDEYRAKYRRKY